MHSDEDRAIINKFLCVNRTANNSPPLPLISATPFLYADADASDVCCTDVCVYFRGMLSPNS